MGLEDLLARATALEEKSQVLHGGAVAVDDPRLSEARQPAANGHDDAWFEMDEFGVKADDGGWAACPNCGSTSRDEFADGTARCEDCGWALTRGGESKGFDFEDVDVDVESKGFDFDVEEGFDFEEKAADEFTRDAIGRFAEESGGGKKKPAKDTGVDSADDYKVEDLDDVRALMRRWDEIPASARAGLKRRMLALIKRESTEEHPHERLIALVNGLGDGDGKREAGEGAGRALSGKPGAAREWLRERGMGDLTRANGKKDDVEGLESKSALSEVELLMARRAELAVD